MGNIYHLSEINLNNKVFTPKIPFNFLVKNGYEDNKTKRICFSTTIDGCLRAMSQNLKDKKLYVHIPDKKYKIYKPTIDEVPDSKITNEVWILEPVKMKCIGIIQVKESIGDGLSYTFGNNKAELYDWDWIWIEKYKSSIYNEMKGKNNMSNIYMEYLTESEREDLILEKEMELINSDIDYLFTTYESTDSVLSKKNIMMKLSKKLSASFKHIGRQISSKILNSSLSTNKNLTDFTTMTCDKYKFELSKKKIDIFKKNQSLLSKFITLPNDYETYEKKLNEFLDLLKKVSSDVSTDDKGKKIKITATDINSITFSSAEMMKLSDKYSDLTNKMADEINKMTNSEEITIYNKYLKLARTVESVLKDLSNTLLMSIFDMELDDVKVQSPNTEKILNQYK